MVYDEESAGPTPERVRVDRIIDNRGKSTYQILNERFLLIQKIRIVAWKALSLVAFFAGIAAASIWFEAQR